MTARIDRGGEIPSDNSASIRGDVSDQRKTLFIVISLVTCSCAARSSGAARAAGQGRSSRCLDSRRFETTRACRIKEWGNLNSGSQAFLNPAADPPCGPASREDRPWQRSIRSAKRITNTPFHRSGRGGGHRGRRGRDASPAQHRVSRASATDQCAADARGATPNRCRTDRSLPTVAVKASPQPTMDSRGSLIASMILFAHPDAALLFPVMSRSGVS